jgi:hypothetical protein
VWVFKFQRILYRNVNIILTEKIEVRNKGEFVEKKQVTQFVSKMQRISLLPEYIEQVTRTVAIFAF